MLLLIIIFTFIASINAIFSGFYVPNTQLNAEDYAGAWLISKNRFLSTENNIRGIGNLEGASFHVVRFTEKSEYQTIMTRDYLDLMVEHLSATTNQLPGSHQSIFDSLTRRMKRTVTVLKERVPFSTEIRFNKTVAIMVYSSIAVSAMGSFQAEIRQYYFESAFWSVYRYFPNIIIAVGSSKDFEVIQNSALPIFKIFNLVEEMNKAKNSQLLPKFALLSLVKCLKTDVSFKTLEYIYYTEGDEILHLRNENEIYNAIDNSYGNLILVPHRMQTLPLTKNFPERLQQLWPSNSNQNLPDVNLVTENATVSRGSCCDSGRYSFADCGTWWYNCPEWGLKNHTVWLKFGKSGFTMPLSTEHQGICTYSAVSKECELPLDCKDAMKSPEKSDGKIKLCGEIPIIRRVGE